MDVRRALMIIDAPDAFESMTILEALEYVSDESARDRLKHVLKSRRVADDGYTRYAKALMVSRFPRVFKSIDLAESHALLEAVTSDTLPSFIIAGNEDQDEAKAMNRIVEELTRRVQVSEVDAQAEQAARAEIDEILGRLEVEIPKAMTQANALLARLRTVKPSD